MEKRKKAPNVDQKTFDCVKILLQSKTPRAEIEKYTGLGHTAIYRISVSETFQDYKNLLAAIALEIREKKAKKAAEKSAAEKKPEPAPEPEKPAEQPAQVVEHRQTVTVQATYYVSQKLDAMTELLKTISAKLACIIDDLYGTAPKKGD